MGDDVPVEEDPQGNLVEGPQYENEDIQKEEDPQPEPERPVRQTRTNTGALPRPNYRDLATGKNRMEQQDN